MDGSRWNWNFGFSVPGSVPYVEQFTDEDTGCTQECNGCVLGDGIIAARWSNSEVRTAIMRPGEFLLLSGFAGNVRPGCENHCDYIFFDDGYSYDDLFDGNTAVLRTFDLRGEVGSIVAEVQVLVQVR